MKVFIQRTTDGECASVNNAIALEGFKMMGWEIASFQRAAEIEQPQPEDIVVGYIGEVRHIWQKMGFTLPAEINYPSELQPFLGRKIWTSTINTIANNPNLWNVFVKPIQTAKKFTGVWVRSTKDLIGCGDQMEDTPVLCSEPLRFLAEWRCFIRYGQVLDVRPYKGDWRQHFDSRTVENAVQAYVSAPQAYALDIGVTDDGRTLLVEVNDGYAIGAYGLFPLSYAKFLSARWAQVTQTRDYCDF